MSYASMPREGQQHLQTRATDEGKTGVGETQFHAASVWEQVQSCSALSPADAFCYHNQMIQRCEQHVHLRISALEAHLNARLKEQENVLSKALIELSSTATALTRTGDMGLRLQDEGLRRDLDRCLRGLSALQSEVFGGSLPPPVSAATASVVEAGGYASERGRQSAAEERGDGAERSRDIQTDSDENQVLEAAMQKLEASIDSFNLTLVDDNRNGKDKSSHLRALIKYAKLGEVHGIALSTIASSKTPRGDKFRERLRSLQSRIGRSNARNSVTAGAGSSDADKEDAELLMTIANLKTPSGPPTTTTVIL